MSDETKADTVEAPLIPDPDDVPVKWISGLASVIVDGTIAITMTTDRVGFKMNGDVGRDLVVAARLRLTLDVAKTVRDHLDRQIKAFAPPIGGQAH